jgi:serine/threonine protein kinase
MACALTWRRARAASAQVFLTASHLAIAMEYAQGGDLFNYTLGHRPHGRLAEQQARWIFQQLIIGLDYCHRRVRPHARPCDLTHRPMTGCENP